MTRNIGFLLGLAAWLALPCAADAQNPQPAAPNEPHPPLASPSSPQLPPERIAPSGRPQGSNGSENLSDRLSRQQGTVQPPPGDAGIRVPLPPNGQGTMPVIPPPGTQGGDQNIVPK
jgi:hypothetical protein